MSLSAASTGYVVIKEPGGSSPQTLVAPDGTFIVEAYAIIEPGFAQSGNDVPGIIRRPGFDTNNNVTAMTFDGVLNDKDLYIVCVGK